jgi:hypothetical protein
MLARTLRIGPASGTTISERATCADRSDGASVMYITETYVRRGTPRRQASQPVSTRMCESRLTIAEPSRRVKTKCRHLADAKYEILYCKRSIVTLGCDSTLGSERAKLPHPRSFLIELSDLIAEESASGPYFTRVVDRGGGRLMSDLRAGACDGR